MYWHWLAAKLWPLIASSLCLLLSAVVGPESCNGPALAEEKKEEEEDVEEDEAKVKKGTWVGQASLMDTYSLS